MHMMREDGQYDRNIWHVLTELIKFVVVDGNAVCQCNLYVGRRLGYFQALRFEKCSCYQQVELGEMLLVVWASSEGPCCG